MNTYSSLNAIVEGRVCKKKKKKNNNNGYLMQIESHVTQDNCLASLAMLNSYRRDRIFNPQLTAIKNSYNKLNV